MPRNRPSPAGLLLGLIASLVALGAAPAVPPDTIEMAALLQSLAARVDPARLSFLVDDRRAEMLAEQLTWPRPSPERIPLRASLAAALLNAGRIDDCLRALDDLEDDARKNAPEAWARLHNLAVLQRAVAYMRLGEEQNCHLGANRESCLMPIRGEGIHKRPEGARRAAELFTRILDEEPGNLEARWLLNVAHMTLGTYPDGVGARDLVPPQLFVSEYPLKRFDNVAAESGLDLYGLAGGAILDDFDNDGDLDLLVSRHGFQDQTRFFTNRGDGVFEERTAEAGITGEVGGLNMIQADYDNDGLVDALVLRGGWMGTEGRFPMSLLRNEGGGRFADVTRRTGLLAHRAPTQTAVWLDADGDGRLDLFVGNETPPGSERDPRPCELFHQQADGTFVNVAREAGVDVVGMVKGVVSVDYDNDRRPDLYVSVYEGANRLFHNDGPRPDGIVSFTDVAAAAGVQEPKASFGAFFFDYDDDGWSDLFVAGYGAYLGSSMASDAAAAYLDLPSPSERGRLYRNKRDGSFEDVTRPAGLYKVIPAMGLNFGDLDNDGWLDFYLGTGNPEFGSLIPNRMFRNDEGRRFQDVTTAGNFGHLQKGHAIAFGDVDGDGDQDVFEEMGGAYLSDKAYSTLYQNPGNGNHWIALELQGVRSSRSAIGARVKVTVDTPSGPRSFYRTVGSGGSFGASPLRREIGLGNARSIVAAEVFWPATGETQTIDGLRLDRRYRIREGVPAATPAPARP